MSTNERSKHCLVTEAELRTLLESHGWKLDMIQKYQTRYAYAKWRKGKAKSRYIATERRFGALTEETVLKRIGVYQKGETMYIIKLVNSKGRVELTGTVDTDDLVVVQQELKSKLETLKTLPGAKIEITYEANDEE